MSSIRPPGIERNFGWVPTEDTAKNRALRQSSLFNAGRHWTPFGIIALGHTLSVNVATGGLSISACDLSIPYHSMALEVVRTLDVQEQHAQFTYLDSHPNTDPRFHFFGNWQFQQEAYISS